MHREKTGFYRFARAVITPLYRFVFRAKGEGLEHFPADTHCILLGNHISAWDPLTLAFFYRHNEVHFLAKDSLFKNKLVAAVLRGLHAIPVARGATDMGAMRAAMGVLKDGHVLGIFPEGHRSRTGAVEKIEMGVAVMALKTDVPLVPVVVRGRYGFFRALRVRVGPPIPMEDLRGRRADAETLAAVKSRIFEALRERPAP